jgi:hypothetical protein
LSDHEPSAKRSSSGIDARRWLALAVVLSGSFVTVMDSSIVNVAIPTITTTATSDPHLLMLLAVIGQLLLLPDRSSGPSQF